MYCIVQYIVGAEPFVTCIYCTCTAWRPTVRTERTLVLTNDLYIPTSIAVLLSVLRYASMLDQNHTNPPPTVSAQVERLVYETIGGQGSFTCTKHHRTEQCGRAGFVFNVVCLTCIFLSRQRACGHYFTKPHVYSPPTPPPFFFPSFFAFFALEIPRPLPPLLMHM